MAVRAGVTSRRQGGTCHERYSRGPTVIDRASVHVGTGSYSDSSARHSVENPRKSTSYVLASISGHHAARVLPQRSRHGYVPPFGPTVHRHFGHQGTGTAARRDHSSSFGTYGHCACSARHRVDSRQGFFFREGCTSGIRDGHWPMRREWSSSPRINQTTT